MHRREWFSLPLAGALGVISHAEIRADDRKVDKRSQYFSLHRLEIENWKEKYSETLPPIDIFTSHPDENGEYMIVAGFREQTIGYVEFSFTIEMNGISFGKDRCQIAIDHEGWVAYMRKTDNVVALKKEVNRPNNSGLPLPMPLQYRAVGFQVFLIKR